jgi:hypothetical protein
MEMDKKTGELAESSQARAVDVDTSGKLCAVGFRDGSVRVYAIPKDW